MTAKTIDVWALLRRFDEVAGRATRLAYPVRDGGLQRKQIEEVDSLHDDLREAKLGAIHGEHEELANQLLGLQAVARALAQELRMWVLLREGDPHEAWNAFVDAQEHAYLALRTPASNSGIEEYVQRLRMIERAVFPPLIFMSAGIEHDIGRCSVCNSRFDTCDHIEGQIYCGQVCAEVDFSRFEPNHVAIVKHPRDKRCYVSEVEQDDGTSIDTMTGLQLDRPKDKDGEHGRKLRAVIFANVTPPGVDL